jgi:hypothetical protein
MNTAEILKKIRSVKLCLMAHPDNEPDSEFADRISDMEEIELELSVATPEAEAEYLRQDRNMYMSAYDDKVLEIESLKSRIKELEAAIKKDEPDLVAKDDYEPSKIHPQPSEPVASHSSTSGNNIEQ